MTLTTKTLATFAAGMVLATIPTLAPPADAIRIIPGYDYPDLCRNRGDYAMPGEQTLPGLIFRRFAFVDPAQEPNRLGRRDCQPPTIRHHRGA